MIFRRPPKRRPELLRAESPSMRLLRWAVIGLLLGGAAWGFWENNNRRMAMLARPPVAAEAPLRLSPQQAEALERYAARFEREYGLPLVLEVRSEPPSPAVLDALAGKFTPTDKPRRVVLVICPRARAVFFLAPAAILWALDEDAQALAGPLFVPYFASGDWLAGLEEALNRMSRRLDAAAPFHLEHP